MFEKMMPRDKKFRMVVLLLVDICVIQFSSFMGLWMRFDMRLQSIPENYRMAAVKYAIPYTLITLVIFYVFRMYSSMWSVAGVREACHIVFACVLTSLCQIAGMTMLQLNVPRSYFAISFIILTGCEGLVRLSYRIYRSLFKRYGEVSESRILIVGAGTSGSIILKEIETSQFAHGRVACFVDDDKNKIGKFLNGVPIAGNRYDIPQLVEKYKVDKIYVAAPSAPAKEIKKILEICRETNCQLKILPGIFQLLNGDVSVSKLREVQIEDLLGRDPIRVNLDEIMGYVSNKVILVTGGGGSIGSELCRQIASHNPKQLIIVDIYENNAYDIQQELRRTYPELDLVVLIGSVRNTHRMNSIFEQYRPQIVYHAAAHKHVPLMEDSPNEAVKNNVFGTYKTAKAASRYGVERFVLISTDKAVNPTNIMGASKRMCEMVIQMLNKESKTDFVAVRFGNVLGSNGSVIPLFKKQIAEGGPVTVTHPDIIRYFMTIPEAVNLVLQCSAYANGGEIFILDMGEPVKIVDLAKKMIRLSGHVPGEDIKIEFTGLRPGEKLYEELLIDEKNLIETDNERIFVAQMGSMDVEATSQKIADLIRHAYDESKDIRAEIKELVPEYQENGEGMGE